MQVMVNSAVIANSSCVNTLPTAVFSSSSAAATQGCITTSAPQNAVQPILVPPSVGRPGNMMALFHLDWKGASPRLERRREWVAVFPQRVMPAFLPTRLISASPSQHFSLSTPAKILGNVSSQNLRLRPASCGRELEREGNQRE